MITYRIESVAKRNRSEQERRHGQFSIRTGQIEAVQSARAC